MNRRRTDINGERVTCTVAGIQTELRFDYEHMPAEPAAGYLTDGYVIGIMLAPLTTELLRAICDSEEDCITVNIDGRDVPIGTSLDRLRIGRGMWELESEALESVLAEWMWQKDADEKSKAFSLHDEIDTLNRTWMRANGVGV